MPEQNSNAEIPCNSLAQQIARCEREATACWAGAGDESNSPEIRYQYAWGALDWELNIALLTEMENAP